MGIVIFYGLMSIASLALALFYRIIMRKIYKQNKNQFSWISIVAWIAFLYFLYRLSFIWIIEFFYRFLWLTPFVLSLIISFHETFRVIRHYKATLLMFLLIFFGVPSIMTIKAEKQQIQAEKEFSNNFSESFSGNFLDVYYSKPRFLDKKYFHQITREELNDSHYHYEQDLFNPKTLDLNPVLVPNVVNLESSVLNDNTNIIYLGNKPYKLKETEIYVLKCRDVLTKPKLQTFFEGKKILCLAEYNEYPLDTSTANQYSRYRKIAEKFRPKTLPERSGYQMKILLNIRPYMYQNDVDILEDDILFVDVAFMYKPVNAFTQKYYNPALKAKNFCPVEVWEHSNKCIEFRKLFMINPNNLQP